MVGALIMLRSHVIVRPIHVKSVFNVLFSPLNVSLTFYGLNIGLHILTSEGTTCRKSKLKDLYFSNKAKVTLGMGLQEENI